MAENVFQLLNILPLPIWIGMLLFPRTRFTQNLVTSYWPFIALGAIYTLILIAAAASGGSSFNLSFDALRAGLSSEWGFAAGWAHYMTLDLFAGVWIFRDAKYWGINPGLFLLLTLFAGPLGLGLYLFVRQRRQQERPRESPELSRPSGRQAVAGQLRKRCTRKRGTNGQETVPIDQTGLSSFTAGSADAPSKALTSSMKRSKR